MANSRFVAGRIRRYYGRDAEVVHPPVDVDFFTPGRAAAEGGGGGYCLRVSALAPYKRLELAIAACDQLGLELRVVGDGPERERLARAWPAHGDPLPRAAWSGERLRDLYRGALASPAGGRGLRHRLRRGPRLRHARWSPPAGGGVLDVVEDGRHGVLYDPRRAVASGGGD